jgi:2-dehydropantoate 2-reductase
MARAGEDVTFIDPRRPNVETIKAKGLQVSHIRDILEWSTPVLALHLTELQQAAKESRFISPSCA